GAIASIRDADGVSGDMGGGSLELSDISGGDVGACESYRLGGLALQARSDGSTKAARTIVRDELEGSDILPGLKGRTFYAVGGTWRSLAKLHREQTGYPLNVMHGYRLDGAGFRDFLKELIKGPVDSLPSIQVVSRQRKSLLPYGALVLSEVLRIGKPKGVVVSALGLREGLLYEKLPEAEKRLDPLLCAVEELSLSRSRSPAHGRELIGWTGQAMAALGIEETPEEARLRAAACHLSDIGWRAHPDYRGEQSLNIIANAGFVGTDHPGRIFLALAAYYRHSGLSDDELGAGLKELATPRYRERALALAAIFRVAYLISASMPDVLPKTVIRRQGKMLQLEFPNELASLAGGRLEARFTQLAALGGYSALIRIEG
ncbi:MAG: Ppx/GppA phosphatase family protein, partial [Alphaproteobacteria bacterium]